MMLFLPWTKVTAKIVTVYNTVHKAKRLPPLGFCLPQIPHLPTGGAGRVLCAWIAAFSPVYSSSDSTIGPQAPHTWHSIHATPLSYCTFMFEPSALQKAQGIGINLFASFSCACLFPSRARRISSLSVIIVNSLHKTPPECSHTFSAVVSK